MVLKFCSKSEIFISWKVRIVAEKMASVIVATEAVNPKARW